MNEFGSRASWKFYLFFRRFFILFVIYFFPLFFLLLFIILIIPFRRCCSCCCHSCFRSDFAYPLSEAATPPQETAPELLAPDPLIYPFIHVLVDPSPVAQPTILLLLPSLFPSTINHPSLSLQLPPAYRMRGAPRPPRLESHQPARETAPRISLALLHGGPGWQLRPFSRSPCFCGDRGPRGWRGHLFYGVCLVLFAG